MKMSILSCQHLFISILFVFLCVGCAYAPTPLVGTQDKTVLEAAETDQFNAISPFDSNNILWGGSVYTRKFSLNSAVLEEYVNTIAEKLVASWPKPVPPYSIRLIYGNNLDAHATMNNVIFLSSGWLKGSESEDEVAAVLAHELSHILLQHPVNKNSRAKSSEYLNSFREFVPLGLYLTKMKMKKEGSDYNLKYEGGSSGLDEIANTVLLGTVIYDLKQSLIDPLITRTQEEQADFLAIDLLQKAGYNSYVLRDEIMDRLISYRENIQKEIDLKELLFKEKCRQVEEQAEKDLIAGKMDQVFKSVTDSVIDQVKHEIIKLYEGGQKEHFRPEVRRERLAQYYDQHYKTSPMVKKKIAEYNRTIEDGHLLELHEGHSAAELAFEKLYKGEAKGAADLCLKSLRTRAGNSPYPWYVLGEIRDSERRLLDAKENFSKAMAIGGCSPGVYSQLAELYIDEKDYVSAHSIVNRGVTAFNGDPGPFYLDSAKIYLAENNYASLGEVLDECKSYPDKTISANCNYLQKSLQENSQGDAGSNNLPFNIPIDLIDKLNPFKP